MATRSKKFYEHGYCEIDKNNVTIEIKYISLPKVHPYDKKEYCKTSNECWYLKNGKCDLGNNCPIYIKADEIKTE